MIYEMKKVPVTKTSHPFATAEGHCRLSQIGYVEDEYFMSGTANVYTEKEDFRPEILFPDAPYTTRLLVRRPADLKRFSGNVVVEILNATAMQDIDRMWVDSWKFFTRNGDIYVGITSKGHVVDALKKFDLERYAPISWANPLPDRVAPSNHDRFPFLPQYESGLIWDMLTDLAELLRGQSELNPLRKYGPNKRYLLGWSQSGSYLCRYVRSFDDYNTEKAPAYDGYLAAGCGADLAPLNAYESGTGMFTFCGVPKGSVMGAKEPYININTESENRMVRWEGDFDQPNFKFRTYQIPASSHDSKYNLLDYYAEQGKRDCEKIGAVLCYEGSEGEPLDNPYELVFNAIYPMLYRWVRSGVPAPHAPKIETEITDACHADVAGAWVKNKTDLFGNALGGIRTPAVDAPVGTYSSASKKADGSHQMMFGQVIPFSAEKLIALYGSLANYEALVTRLADKMCEDGFLLREDEPEMIAQTVALAGRRGLS
jgi:hypothetical protein